MNKQIFFMMQIFLICIYLQSIYAKQIEDPVAKHDANMCGIYLCGGFPDLATKYIQSGCDGDFRSFLENEKSSKSEHIMESFIESSQNVEEKEYYTKMLLIIMGITSGLISSFLGYYIGIWEGKKQKRPVFGMDELN